MANLGGEYGLNSGLPIVRLNDWGLPDPYPTEFQPYTEVVQDGNNQDVLLGRPTVKWSFGLLEQWQMNIILGMLANGPRTVYIRTRIMSGVNLTYADFRANMRWPTKGNLKAGGFWQDIELQFTDLVNA